MDVIANSSYGKEAGDKILVVSSYANSLINFRFDLLRLWTLQGYDVVACAPEKDKVVERKLNNIGVRYVSYPLQRNGMSLVADVKTLYLLYQICKRENPSLVFSYTIKPVIYGSIAAWFAGVTNIYSMVTGLGYTFIGQSCGKRLLTMFVSLLYHFALRFNTKVFFQNPDDIELFLSRNIMQESKVVLVQGSGVNLEYFKPTPVPTPPHFLMIARLLKEKGVYEYIEAAKRVRRVYPKIQFSLAGWLEGGGSSVKQVELNEWIESGVIDFLGKLDDVRPAIDACSVYVLPSYREGTPRTVLEAMAMGRAIITSNAPGCRETVIEGKNGLLVEVMNIDSLVEKMLFLIESPAEIEQMGKASLEIVKEKYDVHKVNAFMLEEMGCAEKNI